MVFYVSWNGATEVRYWNFYASDASTGPWELIGTANKTSFETDHSLSGTMGWAYAEALDADRKPLRRGRSSIVKTFVPSDLIVLGCDERGCHDVAPLREGEVFNKTMPDVGDRGNNYTKDLGVSTASYYPILEHAVRRWSLSAFAIPAILVFLLAGGVSYMLGKRKLARIAAVGHERLLSFAPSFLGGRTTGDRHADTEYHKLEMTEST